MRITAIVKPNSANNEIVYINEKEMKVNIKAKPDKGKANIGLIKFLRKKLGKDVRIVSGLTSHKKILEIFD